MWNRKIPVLLYHRIFNNPSQWLHQGISLDLFYCQMKQIKQNWRVISLEEYQNLLSVKKIPKKTLVLTFDDGYQEHFSQVAPILSDLKLSACFFIPTAYLGTTGMWSDELLWIIKHWPLSILDLRAFDLFSFRMENIEQRQLVLQYLKRYLKYRSSIKQQEILRYLWEMSLVPSMPRQMLSKEELLQLYQAGFVIGSHTHQHLILSQCDEKACLKEMQYSKHYLQSILNSKIKYFAYPNGVLGKDFLSHHQKLLQSAGYEMAFSTVYKKAHHSSDRFAFPRVGYDNLKKTLL